MTEQKSQSFENFNYSEVFNEYAQLELNQSYPPILELNKISATQLTVLTGRNGTGKTAFLKAIEQGNLLVKINGEQASLSQIIYVENAGQVIFQKGKQRENNFKITDTYTCQIIEQTLANYSKENSKSMEEFLSLVELRKKHRRPAAIDKLEESIDEMIRHFGEYFLFEDFFELLEQSCNKSIFDISADEILYFSPVAAQFNCINILFKDWFLDYRQRQRENDFRKRDKDDGFVSSDNSKWLNPVEFETRFGPPPWDWVNDLLASFTFSFRISPPPGNPSHDDSYKPSIKNFGDGYQLDKLSSGEATILGLISSLGLGMNDALNFKMPKVWLLDEPDAHLHPSLAHGMMSLIEKVALERDLFVVMTSHNPSTIAMAPEGCLWVIEGEPDAKTVVQVDRDLAIKSLTDGVPTLTVRKDRERQIIVESGHDAEIYTHLKVLLDGQSILPQDGAFLNFISSGGKSRSGNCDQAIALTRALREGGSTTAFALVDRDSKREPSEFMTVVGNGLGYSIENILLSPIAVIGLVLHARGGSVNGSSFLDGVRFSSLRDLDVERINSLCFKLCAELNSTLQKKRKKTKAYQAPIDLKQDDLVEFSFQGKGSIKIPKWYIDSRGHDLATLIRDAFPEIRRYSKQDSDADLMKNTIKYFYSEYPEFIPKELVNSFLKLQS